MTTGEIVVSLLTITIVGLAFVYRTKWYTALIGCAAQVWVFLWVAPENLFIRIVCCICLCLQALILISYPHMKERDSFKNLSSGLVLVTVAIILILIGANESADKDKSFIQETKDITVLVFNPKTDNLEILMEGGTLSSPHYTFAFTKGEKLQLIKRSDMSRKIIEVPEELQQEYNNKYIKNI